MEPVKEDTDGNVKTKEGNLNVPDDEAVKELAKTIAELEVMLVTSKHSIWGGVLMKRCNDSIGHS